ncbi:MAG: SDR family oxidoreductase [Cytophagales bacterium]|nr:SDR family oxidoreductase [Cytophagales bacterium]
MITPVPSRFTGKHVLITGGARGIGFEIARQFAREGAFLTLFDTHAGNLEKAAADLRAGGARVQTYEVDVADLPQVTDAVARAEADAPIEVLINNAGIARETPFLEIEPEDWKRILDVNLTGMFYVAQAVCRRMATRRRGVVVNMGSKNGLDGEFGYAHYNASKGGVTMLTKTMALELAHLDIRVNAVCPGYIQTPMSMEIDSPEFTRQFVDRYIPLNRPGRVEDVAPAFLFLASDESRFLTGQVLILDGGQLAGQKPGNDLVNRMKTDF